MKRNVWNTLFEKLGTKESNTIIVGLDGLSRSGKTTFARDLSKSVKKIRSEVSLFHLDDHIEVRAKRYNTGNEQWQEYYYCQWKVEYLRENLFSKIHKVKELKLNYYLTREDRQIEKKIELPHKGVIFIEGVFLQRPEWRDYLDYVIYLDCPREVRFLREEENTRKEIDKFKERYWKAEDFYLAHIRPKELADVVIEN